MKNITRDEIRLAVDEVRGGVPYRRCPKCKEMKPMDDFGLRKMGVTGKHGGDIVANQSHCRACR